MINVSVPMGTLKLARESSKLLQFLFLSNVLGLESLGAERKVKLSSLRIAKHLAESQKWSCSHERETILNRIHSADELVALTSSLLDSISIEEIETNENERQNKKKQSCFSFAIRSSSAANKHTTRST